MLFLKAWLVLVMLGPTITLADCPDFTFRCPSGQHFTVNTCWKWSRFQCFTCRSIIADMKSRCPRYSCGGSVDKWYGRNDGCSAGVIAGAMTDVFRAACAIHDICYATPGIGKMQCDDDFYHNMRQTCLFPGINSVGIGICYATAGIAYETVKNHGSNFPDFARTCRRV